MNDIGAPTIKFSKYDSNSDGLVDSMHLKLEFKSKPEEVKNIKVVGAFDYSLKKLLQIEMIGLIYVDVDTPNGASLIITDGELKLVQASPILIDSVKRTLYNVDPFDDYQKYSMQEILENY